MVQISTPKNFSVLLNSVFSPLLSSSRQSIFNYKNRLVMRRTSTPIVNILIALALLTALVLPTQEVSAQCCSWTGGNNSQNPGIPANNTVVQVLCGSGTYTHIQMNAG